MTPDLTNAQQFAIGIAVGDSYEKLRWHVSDGRLLSKELEALAESCFRKGMREATEPKENQPS